MAEAPSGHKKGGKKPRGKKHSTRIDMTPMVDLGFLLVTFFIFTTTLSKPTTMQLLMPADKDPNTKDVKANVKEVLILLLADDNRIFYYKPPEGDGAPDVKTTGYSAKGIRKIILDEKKWVAKNLQPETDKTSGSKVPHKLTIIIKPTEKSTYGNFVDILDEMNINEITKYVTVDPDPKELEMIKTSEANAK